MKDNIKTYLCYVCKERKTADQFWKNKSRKDGVNNRCKPCDRYRNKLPRKSPLPLVSSCYICKRHKPIECFKKTNYRRGVRSSCKECDESDRIKHRRYGAIRRYVKAYYKKYPERAKAHSLVFKALKEGRFKKLPCVICGSEKNVEGHHKDYSKPLEVVWLCKPHHWQADKNIIKV